MTKEKMDEFEKLVNQTLPTLRIEKNNTCMYVYPDDPSAFRGSIIQVLINIVSILGLSFMIAATIGKGIRVEVF